MLLSLGARSQNDTKKDDPIIFPFWMVQEIALDLEDLDALRKVDMVNTLIISNLKQQLSDFMRMDKIHEEQKALLQNSISILRTQYEAEKLRKPKSNWFIWLLASIAAFGGGFVVASF